VKVVSKTSVRCTLSWADPATRQSIVAGLREGGRQTMNLRLMPSAKMLVLREVSSKKVIGFAGLDDEYFPAYPELFSLHVDADCRSLRLGTLLEAARAAYLLARGHVVAYTRMEKATNDALLSYRLQSRAFIALPKRSLAPAYTANCHQCELYGGACTKQAFLLVDLAALLERGRRFGEHDLLARLAAGGDGLPPMELVRDGGGADGASDRPPAAKPSCSAGPVVEEEAV
jgi:hypothetical protein